MFYKTYKSFGNIYLNYWKFLKNIIKIPTKIGQKKCIEYLAYIQNQNNINNFKTGEYLI